MFDIRLHATLLGYANTFDHPPVKAMQMPRAADLSDAHAVELPAGNCRECDTVRCGSGTRVWAPHHGRAVPPARLLSGSAFSFQLVDDVDGALRGPCRRLAVLGRAVGRLRRALCSGFDPSDQRFG